MIRVARAEVGGLDVVLFGVATFTLHLFGVPPIPPLEFLSRQRASSISSRIYMENGFPVSASLSAGAGKTDIRDLRFFETGNNPTADPGGLAGERVPMQDYPIFSPKYLLSAIRSKPASFFHDHVRNLLLHSAPHYAIAGILSVCTEADNICIPDLPDSMLPCIVKLRPRHLSTSLESLLDRLQPSHLFFSRITHLELTAAPYRYPIPPGIWSSLSRLPHLTHISFDAVSFLAICSLLLETCKSLKVLVCLNLGALKELYPLLEPVLAQDPRFVVMRRAYFLKDWQMGVHTGIDYWTRAEAFIEKRWTGEVDALQYQIIDDESENIP